MNFFDYKFESFTERLTALIVGSYLADHPEHKAEIYHEADPPVIEGKALAAAIDQAFKEYADWQQNDFGISLASTYPTGEKFVSGMSYEFARFISDICK
jgi:hypothetical protein